MPPLKGYLHYKMISSENVLFESQVKNFFVSEKSYVPFLRYSSFCIFVVFDIIMSISI